MGAKSRSPKSTPLIPLPRGQVLLPGVVLRISIAYRPDIAALLAHIYSTTTTANSSSSILIGCVPLGSPLLSSDGKRLIGDGADPRNDPGNNEDVKVEWGNVKPEELFGFGTLAKVTGVQGRVQGELSLIVEGLSRFRVERILKERPYFEAQIEQVYDDEFIAADREVNQRFKELKQLSKEMLALIRLSSIVPQMRNSGISPILARRLEQYITKKDLIDAGEVADFMASVLESSHEDKLMILASADVPRRLEMIVEILQRQIASIQGNGRVITVHTKDSSIGGIDIEKLRRLTSRLGPSGLPNVGVPPGGFQQGAGDEQNDVEELKKKLEDAKLSPEADRIAQRELGRLQKMNPAQAEYQVCRNYLETLSEIPWTTMTQDNLDTTVVTRARKQLDDDHYGLEKIKKRLLEYLAVLRLKKTVNADLDNQIIKLNETAKADPKADPKSTPELSQQEIHIMEKKRMLDKAPILLLVGPPGTGKTSLAKSVAAALGRKFHRISLGGVRDEAEIRGHRRTYVAAMPGVIVNGLKKVGVANPVILLDEIDKIGMANHHGDPSAAMLEVLDPEQNHAFVDHYVNIPLDLSKILFIATANSLDTIPAPLLDRMEMIQLSGYTTLEKRHIAARHLLPKQITTNGLADDKVLLPEEVMDKIITSYTRESGVRNLEREIGSVCRYKAVEFAESQDSTTHKGYNPTVTITDLEEILGIERFDEEIAERSLTPGIVTGLVAYSTGGQGSILFIEIADMPGKGSVQLTGTLGDVLKESVEVALSWVKAHAYELGLTADPSEDIMKNRSIHVHCPSGAIPKDGPSAGVAHTIALISLFSGRAVPPSIAMTGEISLRGKVTPVGGIKEKLIGALRAGVKTVLLPIGNRKDVKDLPQEVKDGLQIIHVR